MSTPPPGSGGGPGGVPSPADMLRDPRAIADTTVAPLVFLAVNAVAGLKTAAWVAIGLAVVLLLERLVRRMPPVNALGGLFGTGIAVVIALRTGSVEGYFWPAVVRNAVLAVVFVGSVVIGRPVIGLLARGFFGHPAAYLKDKRVRRTFSEVTLAWVVLWVVRAVTYVGFILAGKAEYLAGVVLILGWPAFALLVFGTFRYVPKRLAQLGAPEPESFAEPDDEADAPGEPDAEDLPPAPPADDPSPAGAARP